MIIGLDLDNTLICYDRLFHRLARERSLIGPVVPARKVPVRDAIRAVHGDEAWQELQGLAYGPRLSEAELFPGAREALTGWRAAGWRPIVISHKTRCPARGDWELRAAALVFLERGGLVPDLIAGGDVFFTDDLAAKVRLVGELGCRAMIDDLPEVFRHPLFPAGVARLWFDPGLASPPEPGLTVCGGWADLDQEIRNCAFRS